MRIRLIWIGALVVLVTINVMIAQKEYVLKSGTTMFLKLAPRDPRSLIQGDYMDLAYEMERQAPRSGLDGSGRLVVRLDDRRVAHYVRIHRGEDLGPGERLLFYRERGGMRLGAESFFFQEGQADRYARARYALLKVTPSGRSVLADLRGEAFEVLSPGTVSE